MENITINNVEYKLTPVKKLKETKNVALFLLTMPNNNSWNGKWSGEKDIHAFSQIAFRRGKPIFPNLKEGNFFYDFGDGWGANIEVKYTTSSEAKKIIKKSKGFCGYEWMCYEIMQNGRIKEINER